MVVGGGWAGFGAAKALTEAGPYDVTLLDANPHPGGLSAGWRTTGGRAVEAGECTGCIASASELTLRVDKREGFLHERFRTVWLL